MSRSFARFLSSLMLSKSRRRLILLFLLVVCTFALAGNAQPAPTTGQRHLRVLDSGSSGLGQADSPVQTPRSASEGTGQDAPSQWVSWGKLASIVWVLLLTAFVLA